MLPEWLTKRARGWRNAGMLARGDYAAVFQAGPTAEELMFQAIARANISSLLGGIYE